MQGALVANPSAWNGICLLFKNWQVEVILRKPDEFLEIRLADTSNGVDVCSRTTEMR